MTIADESFMSIFDDASSYKRWLDFLFKANQLGLVDPDSLTQRWNDFLDKATAGRTLFSYWSWGFGSYQTPERSAEAVGFMPVFIADTKMNRGTEANYIGATWDWGIGKGTKYLDKCLEFLNFHYSYEGAWLENFGEQGDYWDMDENGPYITESGFALQQDPEAQLAKGGRPGDGINVINSGAFSGNEFNPLYNATYNTATWQRKDYAPEKTALVQDWEKITGYNSDNTIPTLKEKGLLVEKPFAPSVPLTDDIDQIRMRLGDMCKTQSWLMIFAKDQAEFDALWADMVEQAKGMNVDAVVNAIKENYETSKAAAAKYTN